MIMEWLLIFPRVAGGLFIMTGDVLPCYDFSYFVVPEDGACIVSVPAALEIACNHGVILTSSEKKEILVNGQQIELEQVSHLLQKPTKNELLKSRAIRSDGTVLLDTGIFAVRGKAWRGLIGLSIEDPDPISALLQHQKEVSHINVYTHKLNLFYMCT
jgi:fucokinase